MKFPTSTLGRVALVLAVITIIVLLVIGLGDGNFKVEFRLPVAVFAGLGIVGAFAAYGFVTPSPGDTWEERLKAEGPKVLRYLVVGAAITYGIAVYKSGSEAFFVAVFAIMAATAEVSASLLGAAVHANRTKTTP